MMFATIEAKEVIGRMNEEKAIGLRNAIDVEVKGMFGKSEKRVDQEVDHLHQDDIKKQAGQGADHEQKSEEDLKKEEDHLQAHQVLVSLFQALDQKPGAMAGRRRVKQQERDQKVQSQNPVQSLNLHPLLRMNQLGRKAKLLQKRDEGLHPHLKMKRAKISRSIRNLYQVVLSPVFIHIFIINQ